MRKVKQVIVMRKDLNMRKGKMIAQGAHASLGAILREMESKGPYYSKSAKTNFYEEVLVYADNDPLDIWLNQKFTKICVSVTSEQELLDIYNKAKEQNLICSLIQDAGDTEFNGVPTYTCCAIGPDYTDIIDNITGSLQLL